MSYYHGGLPGLRVGDVISSQPMGEGQHLVSGCAVCEARREGKLLEYDENHRFDRTYVTTDRFIARCFAVGYPKGSVYYVEPIGELELDPEHEDSWAVPAARVKAVLDGYVTFTPKDFRKMAKVAGVGLRAFAAQLENHASHGATA